MSSALPSSRSIQGDLSDGLHKVREDLLQGRFGQAQGTSLASTESAKNPDGVEYGPRHYLLLGAVAVGLHIVAVTLYLHRDVTPTIRKPVEKLEIELIKPVITPPQAVEPPKPPPPPPPKVVQRQPPPPKPAAPTPALRTAPAEANIPAEALTVQENTEAPKASAPVESAPPEPPAPPPPPKVEEPITEATGNAAYLNNPPPEYPAFAQRQGWEGVVKLKVHVLASGHPDKVEIKQSSGRKTLDESAVNAVKNWTFVPSKRGNTPIDGWATVPIEFKLAK